LIVDRGSNGHVSTTAKCVNGYVSGISNYVRSTMMPFQY